MNKWKIASLILIGILIVGFIIYQTRQTENSDDIDFYKWCKVAQDMSLIHLKSPYSAVFQNCDDSTYENYAGKITVTTYVDSQNSFGAMFRSTIILKVTEQGELISYDIQ